MTVTVKDLIEHLKVMPQDSVVIYCLYSGYSLLELYQVVSQRESDPLNSGMSVVHHNMPGEYRHYGGEWEHKGQPPPKPANVVIFPGN